MQKTQKKENQDEYYRLQRERNNLSVRKSRAKTKVRMQETADRINRLRGENEVLSKEMTQLSKELTILKRLVKVIIQTK